MSSKDTPPVFGTLNSHESPSSHSRDGKNPIRIMIADSQPLFRDGFRALLETEHDFRVIGPATSGATLLGHVQECEPDILLLDMTVPKLMGSEVLRQLSTAGLPVRVVVLTSDIGSNETVQALNLGARGVVLKNSTSTMLFECIRHVMAGEYWVPPDSIANLVERLRHSPPRPTPRSTQFGLTGRELEIILEVVSGASNPEIARKLSISEQTVKHHLTHIFDKLGVYTRVELALFAVNHKLGAVAESAS
jgi:two-component system, NarL family, nitrate/nitrite response regulator NarL